MGDCPKPKKKLTRFGLCYFYNFDEGRILIFWISTSLLVCRQLFSLMHKSEISTDREANLIRVPGPQSSLILYAAYNRQWFTFPLNKLFND